MYESINSRYTYKNSIVIKNKLGIKDEKILEDIERKLVGKKLQTISNYLKFQKFNEEEFKNIHRYLFFDIYRFAGEYRLENITKENFKFSNFEYIDDNIKEILSKIDITRYKTMTKEKLVLNISSLMTDLNVIHPFREGNGRTIRTFISKLFNYFGYDIDFSNINYDKIMRVSKLAVIDETEQIELLMKNVTKM
ncbi:MAG: Fic family protein [Clostridia bacterium]